MNTATNTPAPHVVFGAGQVGGRLAARLLAEGCAVRVAKRHPGGVPEGVETILGDAADPAFCARAAAGAHTIYHCMNPAYSAALWAKLVPLYMDNLIAAARTAGARLVALDNLYMLGRPSGRAMGEDTPPRPASRKGDVRARAAQRLLDAAGRGEVRALTARASDFYGPGGTGTHFAERFWKPAFAGKTAQLVIHPDTPHTYHYIPDVAASLAALGTASDDVFGRVWMLPCAPAEPARALVARFATALGREIRVSRAPRWVVKAMGLFVPIVRELEEMLYQWEEPFVVDDSRFRARFALRPTDLEEAARATVAWARATYEANGR